MVVEVFGLCGIGKSTILKDLLPLLKQHNSHLTFDNDEEPSPTVVRFYFLVIIIRLLNALTIKQFIKAISAGNYFYLIGKLSYRHAKRNLNNSSSIIAFNESGFIQSLITYVIEDQLKNVSIGLEKILMILKAPDVLIFFDGNVLNAEQRYKRREKEEKKRPVRRNKGYLDLNNRFREGEKLCYRVKNYYSNKKTKIIVVNSDFILNQSINERIIEINKLVSEINIV